MTDDSPRLTLAGEVMSDHYQIASLTLAFARESAVERESCWALALGAATLVSCASENATLCIERGSSVGDVRLRLYGTWAPDTEDTVARTIARLRELGFQSTPAIGTALLIDLRL